MRRTIVSLVVLGALASPAGAQAIAVGFNEDGDRLVAGSKALKRANVPLARFPVSWERLEPQQGRLEFDYVDNAVRSLERIGVRPLISVFGTPDWAAGPQVPLLPCALSPSHDDDYRRIWRELAQRYPQALLAVLNEPNIDPYGNLEAERAAELTNLAARAVWSVDPGRRVIGPGASPGEEGWLGYMRDMYRLVDPRVELGAHIYPFGSRLMVEFRRTIKRLQGIAGRRQLWITETGVSRSLVSGTAQRRFVRQAYRYARGRARAIIFHRLWSPHAATSTQGWDAGLSALRADGSPTRLYRTIAALAPNSGPGKRRGGSGPLPAPGPLDDQTAEPPVGCSG